MFVENTNKWVLLLDDVDNPTHYFKNLKDACEYMDIDASTFLSYSLPQEPVDFPTNQTSWHT